MNKNPASQTVWITNRNMDQITLEQTSTGWRFRDHQGRTVRLSILVPSHFTCENEARMAAANLGSMHVTADLRLAWGSAA